MNRSAPENAKALATEPLNEYPVMSVVITVSTNRITCIFPTFMGRV